MLSNKFRNIMGALMLASLAACGDDAVAPLPSPSATLTITPPSVAVYEADAVVLSAVYRDQNGVIVPNTPVTWSVQDTTRALLGANGYLLALKAGVVQVTARNGSVSTTYNLVIARPQVLSVSVFVSPALSIGDVATVGVRSNGSEGRVVLGRLATLSSDNPAIASVDAAGRVHAVAAGTTTIRATVEGVVGSASVTVAAGETQFVLSKYNGASVPQLIDTATVSWDGVTEFHEVYAEAGTLVLSGTNPLRYRVSLRIAEYNVATVNGQRRLELRMVGNETDRGLVSIDLLGDLQLTSEIYFPLSHNVSASAGGMDLRYRIPGTDEFRQLFFRREPL